MEVFVANATKQILQFCYRLPERRNPITIPIPVGRQIKLSAGGGSYDLTQPDVDGILEQWGKYGLIAVGELESNRHSFQGYLYAIKQPIAGSIIERAARYREDVLKSKGLEIRKEAAMEMINTIEREAKRPADNYEVTVVEEEPRGGYSSEHTHVAEGYRATRDRPNMPETPTPLRGRRRAA